MSEWEFHDVNLFLRQPLASPFVVITDIFGLTDDVIALAKEHSATIIDPYQGVHQSFTNEAQAYQHFIEQCGHDAYVDRIWSVINSMPNGVKVLSFSAGASAVWRLTERFSPHKIEHLIGFYPSQIRHHLNVNPNSPVTLIFPSKENHFDVDKVIKNVSKSASVQCIKTAWRHGFMNPRSDNYHEQAVTVFANVMNKGAL
jgi:dienelactone hydrolase